MNYSFFLSECRHHVIATAYKKFHRTTTIVHDGDSTEATAEIVCLCLHKRKSQKRHTNRNSFLVEHSFSMNHRLSSLV